MTNLEAEIIAIVEKQGLTIVRAHGEAHLLLAGNAFLNLTSVAKSLEPYIERIEADAYEQGHDDVTEIS